MEEEGREGEESGRKWRGRKRDGGEGETQFISKEGGRGGRGRIIGVGVQSNSGGGARQFCPKNMYEK